MPFDEHLANRIRELLSTERGVQEKVMFGMLVFLIGGKMAIAASGKGGVLVRVPPADTEALLQRKHVSPMVMSGRESRGWVFVADAGVNSKRQLQDWVSRGVSYAKSLPAK